MKVRKTILPGDKGSLRFLKAWGEDLVAVRYRDSTEKGCTVTTIEIIVDERSWRGNATRQNALLAKIDKKPVAIRLSESDAAMHARLKRSGAWWSQKRGIWITTYQVAKTLGLRRKIVDGLIEVCAEIDTSFL